MSYSGGRWVITKVENETVHLEGWHGVEGPSQTLSLKQWPAAWPECKPGLQLLLTIHKNNRVSWLPAKKQTRERVIYVESQEVPKQS